jgi:hypothetical protein
MDWSCVLPLAKEALAPGHTHQVWPTGYLVVPREASFNKGLHIAFTMFSPTRISARSCSHGRCVRIGVRIWWIPPPRCVLLECCIGVSRSYSQVYCKFHLLGIKSVIVL